MVESAGGVVGAVEGAELSMTQSVIRRHWARRLGVMERGELSVAERVLYEQRDLGNATIRWFSKHAANQAMTRGFKTSDILKIVREGEAVTAIGRHGPQIRYTLVGNTVVVSSEGKVITVFSNYPGTRNKLGRGNFIPFK